MENYKININVLTSLHIGSGESIQKFEYIAEDFNQINIIDIKKLIKLLNDENIFDKYLSFVQRSSQYNKNIDSSLYNFLKNHNIYNPKNIEDITLYKITNTLNQVGRLENIKTFVKDNKMQPYIPGSSLKGALINIISSVKNLNNVQENEISKAISVSDSKPLKHSDLMINKVFRYNIKKNMATSLPEYVEFLKPKTKITATLSINPSVITITEIVKCINQFTATYQNYYLSNYAGSGVDDKVSMLSAKENSEKMYLGAYTGFTTKSINYSRFKNQTGRKSAEILLNAFRKFKNIGAFLHKDNISPINLKCINYKGILCANGEIGISFEKVNKE